MDKTSGEDRSAGARKVRKVILFSDGTGNSSGKLFKTNVWRLYEAIDLGPTDDGSAEQIALYSNGVGTSTFRPLAVMGGVFGLGLKSNVIELYKYLCRNWHPKDEICLFGFSRGAFTIRLLAGLIASQGILRGDTSDMPPDEDTLAYKARAAYRAFAGSTWPNRPPARWVAGYVRAARDMLLSAHRRFTGRDRYDLRRNCFTDMAFVGVWDTVAAYGGPIVEITRGIDDWIWPLTMPNYQLSPRVLKARHALSLDDERDAFQPLLWDEVREEMLVRWGGATPVLENGTVSEVTRRVEDGRLKQVWFSGMHADVGGGYPDESLSYVSLLWMIDELDGALRLLPEHVRRIASMSNVYGPIHDSRSGSGGYYRFQPRRIRALVDWFVARKTAGVAADAEEEGASVSPSAGQEPGSDEPVDAAASSPRWFEATRSLRDPEIADAGYLTPERNGEDVPAAVEALADHIRRDHGLLTSVRVHESAIARIASGTDNYAPLGLPGRFDIVFAEKKGASKNVLDPRVALALRNNRRDEASAGAWEESDGFIGDTIWWRRVQYFSLVFVSILLVTLPLWAGIWDRRVAAASCVDGRCVARPVLELVNTASGGYLKPWVGSFATHVLPASVLALLAVLLFTYGSAYELRLRSRARRLWRQSLAPPTSASFPPRSARRGLARVREGARYQRFMTAFKWLVAPLTAGWCMILGAVVVVLGLLMQLTVYPVVERHAWACGVRYGESGADANRLERLRIAPDSPAIFDFATNERCARSGRMVEEGKDYAVRVTVVGGGWSDGGRRATPAAGGGADLNWVADALAIPFRRVTLVGWLQPLTIVRREDRGGWWARVFGRRVDIDGLALTCDPGSGGYVARFRPRTDGYLDMSVNDAIAPWDLGYFYRNNAGKAVVQVWTGKQVPARVPKSRRPLACAPDAL